MTVTIVATTGMTKNTIRLRSSQKDVYRRQKVEPER
jgi:hypothetical protein